jgi:beta-ureidopropionase / N-carbamoyl-L-amino-acid hydrolase
MPRIDGDRLLADLRRIADFGRYETGVHRPHLSQQDVESRRWLAARMAEAGLDATIDGVGNVIGRSRASGPRLLMGSHTDTQPRGGWLDGVMGVIYGLEVARAFRADPTTAGLGIDVASWADEESHFVSMMGSRSFIGKLTEDEIDAARHREDGTPLRDALAAAGLAGVPRLQLEDGRYRAYLEAHIEQGGVLEASARRIGIVTAIVGSLQYRLVFTGSQNHAGTTPMPMRRDAGVAMMRLFHDVQERFPALAAERSVWTVGRMSLEPGAPSVIPGRAEMLFQFRDTDIAVLRRMEAGLLEIVDAHQRRGPCGVECVNLSRTMPTLMADDLQNALEASAAIHAPAAFMRMPSGAGHDAQILGQRLPAAMLFVPSIGGVSHHFSEDTAEADIVLGCQVFADAAAAILAR